MNDSGFILIHRRIMNWEWYKNPATMMLFVHLLLTANYTDGRFEGEVIKRGQLVTSLRSLSTSTGLTIQQTRTALEHLQSTGEITSRTGNRNRVITISKYDDYQLPTSPLTNEQQAINKPATNEQQTDNKQTTSNQQQYNKYNKSNKEINEKRNEEIEGTPPPRRFSPPTREQVQDFCSDVGIQIDVDRFMNYYESVGWKVGGKAAMKDWKAAVRNWASRDAKAAPAPQPRKTVAAQQYGQRDYSQYTQDEGLAMMMAMMQREDDV